MTTFLAIVFIILVLRVWYQAVGARECERLFAEMYPELAAGDYDNSPEVKAAMRRLNAPALAPRVHPVKARRPVGRPRKVAPKVPTRPVALPSLPMFPTVAPAVPVAPVVASVQYAPPEPVAVVTAQGGKPFHVMTETLLQASGVYAVLEESDIIASHHIDLSKNPRHNGNYQGRKMTSQARAAKVAVIEATLNPSRYLVDIPICTEGPTIVDDHNLVLGGNARCIAIQRRYRAGTNDAFRQAIIDRASAFGLDPADVAAMRCPVIVRRVLTQFESEAAKEQFARDTDIPPTQNRSAAELARADSEKIDAEMMKAFAPGEDGDMNNIANARFIQSLMARIGSSEWQGLTDDKGLLSQDGQRRLQAAVMMKAYSDSSLIELAFVDAAGDTGRNLVAGLLAVAPRVLQSGARGEFIGQCARQFLDVKRAGGNVLDHCENLSFDAAGNMQAVAPECARLLRLFDGARSRKALTVALREYLAENAEGSGMDVSMSMFSGSEVIQFGAQQRPLAEVGRKSEEGDLFAAAPESPKEDGIRFTSPLSGEVVTGEVARDDDTCYKVHWQEDDRKLTTFVHKSRVLA